MRLGGRLAGAIEVLADIEGRRRPVADALKDWGLAHRFAGSGDRAAIGIESVDLTFIVHAGGHGQRLAATTCAIIEDLFTFPGTGKIGDDL